MADYLPTELQIKILQKLPVKSLLRFTAVSKSWRSIITSPALIASHLSNSKNQTLLLLRRYDKHDNREQYSLLEFTEDGANSSSQLEFPFEFEIDRFRVVGSCGGLVCLSDDVFDNHSQPSIIIWNPSVRYHLVLPDPTINPDRKDCYTFVLGFGGGVAATASHAYKVARLVYFVYCSYFTPKVEIFSVKTMSWRRVRGVDVTLRAYSNMYCQVFFNGVVHWLSEKEPIDYSNARLSSILAFDIENEVFGEVMLPRELANASKVPTLHIFVIGESLGVVKYVGCACGVWVMKEYRVEESWTRLYIVDLMRGVFRVMGFRKCGEALLGLYRLDLDTNKIDLVSYSQDTRRVKDLGILRRRFMLIIMSKACFCLDDMLIKWLMYNLKWRSINLRKFNIFFFLSLNRTPLMVMKSKGMITGKFNLPTEISQMGLLLFENYRGVIFAGYSIEISQMCIKNSHMSCLVLED